jgi:hypothetical protein
MNWNAKRSWITYCCCFCLFLLIEAHVAFGQDSVSKKDISTIKIDLTILSDYQKYCYNDSSVQYYRPIEGDIEMPCDSTLKYTPWCNSRIIHRKPDFEDFINWLKDNYDPPTKKVK